MVLLDEILEVTSTVARARVCLSPQEPQVLGDGAPTAWALEILAQTAALVIAGELAEHTFRQGRLIRVKRFCAYVLSLPASKELESRVKLNAGSDTGVFLFEGHLRSAEGLLASAEFTLYAI